MSLPALHVTVPSGVAAAAPALTGDKVFTHLSSAAADQTGILPAGRYTLLVSKDTSVRVRWSASGSAAVGTDMQLPASGRLDFDVQPGSTTVLSVFPDVGTFHAWIWRSQGVT